MEFDAPEDVKGEGGNFLDQPGTYHVVISKVIDGEGPKGGAIDGFTFEMDVLAGTVKGCAGKTHKECLFAPDLSRDEKNQLNAKRKLAAFFIATNVMQPEQLGKPVKIDVSAAEGQQLIIKFDRQMKKDDNGDWTIETKFLQISYSDMFHVDDPEVASIPKSEDALAMIDKSLRHDAKWFAFKDRVSGKKPAAKEETVAAGSVNVDDIFN